MANKELRIRAACAISANSFCISLSELHLDDPFSVILIWEEGLKQPWARIDVKQNICSVTASRFDKKSAPEFVALSDEGDVYFLRGLDVRREKILGAGITSKDAGGLGAMHAIREVVGDLVAVGQNGQVYVRAAQSDWKPLFCQKPDVESPTDIVDLTTIVDGGSMGLLTGGTLRPGYKRDDEALAALKSGNSKLYAQLVVKRRRINCGCLYWLKSGKWGGIDIPEKAVIRDLARMEGNGFRVACASAVLYSMNTEGEFDKILEANPKDTMVSLTVYKNKLVAATRAKIFSEGDGILAELPRTLPASFANTVRVQATESTLWLFDSNGVGRFDGKKWSTIDIPPEFLRARHKDARRLG